MLKVLLEYLVFFQKTLLISVIFVLCLIFVESSRSFAANDLPTDTITVTATIEPERHVIVGQNHKITEVLTNTPLLVTPIVSLDSLTGAQLQYSNEIADQYQQIINSCNFDKNYGVIYSFGACSENLNKSVPPKSALSSLLSSIEADTLGLFMGHKNYLI